MAKKKVVRMKAWEGWCVIDRWGVYDMRLYASEEHCRDSRSVSSDCRIVRVRVAEIPARRATKGGKCGK